MNNWEELKVHLQYLFQPSQDGSLRTRFLALRQTTTVKKYRWLFERLASLLQNISEEILECNFINGLKPRIKAEVQLLNPVGLEQIMDVAQRVEERDFAVQQGPNNFILAKLKGPLVSLNTQTP